MAALAAVAGCSGGQFFYCFLGGGGGRVGFVALFWGRGEGGIEGCSTITDTYVYSHFMLVYFSFSCFVISIVKTPGHDKYY